MIFNQQALFLHGTENREQRTMILIQGKNDIYFKYFCRMTEVIYSVIIGHIVKWTIMETVILAGSGESEAALHPGTGLCSMPGIICEPGESQRQVHTRTVHIPTWTLKVGSPLFAYRRNSWYKCLHWEVAQV